MSQEKNNGYNDTLQLPKTDFPMRAKLPAQEPQILEKWEQMRLYDELIKKNRGKPSFILHDGPPYANGDIHIGHALNKILKDVIVKYKNMSGYFAPYVPGWDTHGLPIEQQAIKKLGINRHEVGPVKFRQACREFASSYIEKQKQQFKCLGVIGDWDHPYRTFTNDFVAKQIEIFGKFAEKGLIYKGLKPVFWCYDCETALAEAEIEYAEDKTNSVYVKFEVKDDKGKFNGLGKVYFVIWTTTIWTLPGNVAICVNPDFEYIAMKVANGETYIVAKELADSVCKTVGIDSYEVVGEFVGHELEYIVCAHPFLDRESLVIAGDHVTLDAGTGCVHTAPGHGLEDYIVCQNYPELSVVVPVDSKGVLNELAGEFAGVFYKKSNNLIVERLKSTNNLLGEQEIIHQYPHCWRCNHPIIYRATEQWFASVDKFKDAAVDAINQVNWTPKWGKDRITSMVRDRNDWCISRQRVWGVPIPIFYCKECGKEIINSETIKAVSDLFLAKGPDSWYELDASEILPAKTKCECGGTEFTKEKDIMDVWFDSGSSHMAVCETHKDLSWPPDMYLEGHDQYRGWFQSSLLTSVAVRGRAPYSSVLSHGFVVDGEGKKMSKSKNNSISPLEIVDKFGADILRLWAVSSDYTSDIRISMDMIKQLSEGYRKIRNTARYILGNTFDFNPDSDMVAYEDMEEIDKWAIIRLNQLVKKSIQAYESYEYHVLYHAIHNFCVVDLSNFYLDVLKDRLYTEKASGHKRRSAQSAMYIILNTLVRLLAPLLTYTAEEIWSYMPHLPGEDTGSVLFSDMPKYDQKYEDAQLEEKWERILAVRSDVLKALELARAQKLIGQSLAANAIVYAKKETFDFLSGIKDELPTIFITSQVELMPIENAPEDALTGEVVSVKIETASGQKCERCWVYSDTVGSTKKHPTLCKRCVSVIEE